MPKASLSLPQSRFGAVVHGVPMRYAFACRKLSGTYPKCTSGAPINGSMLPGGQVGAAAGSDTALVYLLWQGPDSFRRGEGGPPGPPGTTRPNLDCGKDK